MTATPNQLMAGWKQPASNHLIRDDDWKPPTVQRPVLPLGRFLDELHRDPQVISFRHPCAEHLAEVATISLSQGST